MMRMMLCVVLITAIVGCESKSGTGALAGGAGGAGLGAIIGHQSGHTAEGALIGGAVGAVGGAIVGNEMDKSDRRERERDTRESDHQYAQSSQRVSKYDVVGWTRDGVKDEIIIDRIERSGTVFHLTATDERELRDAGVGSGVIRAMRDTSRR